MLRLRTLESTAHTHEQADGLSAEKVTQANSWSQGDPLALQSDGTWTLADADDPTKPASAVVFYADATTAWLVTKPGTVIEWTAHGLASPPAVLWLGASGTIVTADPLSRIAQPLYRVVSTNSLMVLLIPYTVG